MKKFTPAFDEFTPAFWQNTPAFWQNTPAFPIKPTRIRNETPGNHF